MATSRHDVDEVAADSELLRNDKENVSDGSCKLDDSVCTSQLNSDVDLLLQRQRRSGISNIFNFFRVGYTGIICLCLFDRSAKYHKYNKYCTPPVECQQRLQLSAFDPCGQG